MQSPAESLIETKHEDHIHDVAWDYYARKIATASSDRTVKVFAVDGDQSTLCATLTGHDGPVWGVGWAHPSWGVVLASCSYDGTVLVYREDQPGGRWSVVHKWATGGGASINSLEWAPSEYGALMLAVASSDGYFAVLAYSPETESWSTHRALASPLGCNSVAWAPTGSIGGRAEGATRDALRIATGSCDCAVRVWRAELPAEGVCAAGELAWTTEPMAQERVHTEWVRDVAWAPFTGVPVSVIASCSEDRMVYVWCRASVDQPWTPSKVHGFDAPVWRVSWSVTGNILAASSGDDDVSLWKESLTNEWHQLSQSE